METPITAAQQPDTRVGSLVLSSLSRRQVSAERLAKLLAHHGLADGIRLPETLTPAQAFEVACPLGTLREYTVDNGQPTPVRLVITVGNATPDRPCVVHLDRFDLNQADTEVRPGEAQASGTTLAVLWLNSVDSSDTSDTSDADRIYLRRNEHALGQLSADEQGIVAAALVKIRTTFEKALQLLPSHALTNVVADVLIAAGAVTPTGQRGAFYLPRHSDATVAAVEQIVAELTAGDADSSFTVEPVLHDHHKLRALIAHVGGVSVATAITAAQTVTGHVIGHLVLRNIGEFLVPVHKLSKEPAALGIAAHVTVPPQTTPVEAFYTACSPGTRAEYEVPADADDERATVQLETVEFAYANDITAHRLLRRCANGITTEMALASIWLTGTGDGHLGGSARFAIHYDADAYGSLTRREQRRVEQVLAGIRRAYEEGLDTFPPYTLTSLVQRLLQVAGALELHRPGDITVVPASSGDLLSATAQLVTSLAGDRSDAHFVTLPIIAGTKLAAFVTATVAQQFRAKVATAVEQIRQWLECGIDTAQDRVLAAAFEDEAQQLAAQIARYDDLLPADVRHGLTQQLKQVRSDLCSGIDSA